MRIVQLTAENVKRLKAVREGADKARVVLDLDEITVTKKWNKDGVSTLEVTSKEGARFPSPQAMAEEQDAQIIIERVSNGEKIGIVIEDGSVVSAEEGAAK